MLVGEVPFPGGSLVSKLDKQRWQIPAPVHQLRPEIVPAVGDVIAKLLAKKPAERYQTPMELVASLDELLRTNYASSEPAGPMPREVRVLKGHIGASLMPRRLRRREASRIIWKRSDHPNL